MTFSFHRIPVGIDICFLLRVKRVYPAHGMDFPAEVIEKEILAYGAR